MRLLILICLLVFAGERLYLLNWYKEQKRSARIGGAIQAIAAMMAVVGHIWIWLGVAR